MLAEDASGAPILVAFATRYGSTKEVAEAVAATLSEQGLAAKVRPAREVRSLDGYGAVVLGAPLYMGSLLKDARSFLERNQSALHETPLAVFVLGPISAAEGVEGSRGQLDKELAKMPWLEPVAEQVFVGKYDPSRLAFKHKLIAGLPASPLHGLPARDDRDWEAIRDWARGIGATLEASASESRDVA